MNIFAVRSIFLYIPDPPVIAALLPNFPAKIEPSSLSNQGLALCDLGRNAVQQLRRDIREGLESGPARPWNVAKMKREGRKRVAPQVSLGRGSFFWGSQVNQKPR